MSTVFIVVSKNALRDIHGLLLAVQNTVPDMLYQFGKDESKYKTGFEPDVFVWVHQRSTRYLDWSSERMGDDNWHYAIRLPAASNCILWALAFVLIEKIATVTDGMIYTEDLAIDEGEGLNLENFSKWRNTFSCAEKLEQEVSTSISLSEFQGDVTIFGTYAPFTLNKT